MSNKQFNQKTINKDDLKSIYDLIDDYVKLCETLGPQFDNKGKLRYVSDTKSVLYQKLALEIVKRSNDFYQMGLGDKDE